MIPLYNSRGGETVFIVTGSGGNLNNVVTLEGVLFRNVIHSYHKE